VVSEHFERAAGPGIECLGDAAMDTDPLVGAQFFEQGLTDQRVLERQACELVLHLVDQSGGDGDVEVVGHIIFGAADDLR
jgi:hypothetical protein